MDALWRYIASVKTALVALIVSRTALAVVHLYGWYPEKTLAAWIVAFNRRVGAVVGRLLVRFERAPVVPDAPGLVWKRRKDGWLAIWKLRPEIVKRGYQIKRMRLALIETGKKCSSVERQWISDRCTHLQHEMLQFKGSEPPKPRRRPKRQRLHEDPKMEEILQSIRRIIAADDESRSAVMLKVEN
jgi:hypothetical protein